ncbi:transposase [Rubrivivax albus]|uniref:Transposase n=1 Tax=Rubrivivax albus TaxID=2499835 RepID=A0A3S2TP75_9BURK|nr:transposase [Rubrivivax albus]RVT53424.1 transposase [Rubrivivax albus]
MARLPRLTLAGHAHCVRQATVHGQPLTLDAADVQALRGAMRELSVQYRVAIWAYGVLPEALDLVLCPETTDGLGRFMQALGRRYVQAFNRRHGRHGALWAGRYRATVVETGEWLLACILHVEHAAWRAQQPSSGPHHLGQTRDPLLADAPVFWTLGNTPFERELAWRQRLEQGPDPATGALLARAVHGAWAIGSPAFTAELEAATGRPAQPRRPGRPRRVVSD